MLVLKITEDSFKEAITLLRNGGVIVYPTDTAYAVGCDALNKKAIKKIYKIKNRPAVKPLPVIVGSLALAKKFFKFSKKELLLAKRYWPGPLSLVLKIKNKRLKMVYKNDNIVVRVPNLNIAKQLSLELGKPIISTSANISGKRECYSIREVLKQFRNRKFQPDLIIDGGKLKKRKPSTIVKVSGKEVQILRQGPIKIS